jgi:hypothetical protein
MSEPSSQTTWATAAQVLQYTGVQVTDLQVTTAGYIIDLYSGRPYSFSWTDPSSGEVTDFNWWQNVGGADMYYMMLAVCYQTVWMTQQPDIMTRFDVSTIPSMREPLKVADPSSIALGPLAKKSLSRVSWLRSRALHVRSPFEDLYTANSVNFGEWIFPWSPIGGGFGFPSGPDY